MAASASDYFKKASNGTRPASTTLTAIKAVAASSISCGALTGWPTTTGVAFCIYTTDTSGNKVAGSQTDWVGVVSGTSITNLSLKAGTDNGYSIGAIVEASPIAGWADDLMTGVLTQHTQLGAHTAITTDTLTASGVVNTSTVSSLQDTSVALSTYRSEASFDYVASGGVWTADSVGVNLNASMTAIVCYINGQRITVGAVTARPFTLNLDTYIDVLNTAGVGSLVYTTAATNAASPALAANSLRIGIIQAAATITAATKVNQGQEDRVFPVASNNYYSVTDSLGNLICPRDPNRKVLGYRQITTDFAVSSATASLITNAGGTLSVPVIVPTGRKVKVSAKGYYQKYATATGSSYLGVYDTSVGGSQVAISAATSATANAACPAYVEGVSTPAATSKTYVAGINGDSGAVVTTFGVGAAGSAWIKVELA